MNMMQRVWSELHTQNRAHLSDIDSTLTVLSGFAQATDEEKARKIVQLINAAYDRGHNAGWRQGIEDYPEWNYDREAFQHYYKDDPDFFPWRSETC